MCDTAKHCSGKNRFVVAARRREASTRACGIHLPTAVREMDGFNDERYKRRPTDNGVMVYPVKAE